MALRTALLTTAAMVAFATNSLLCRLALGEQLIDAASFASVRVISGAVMLTLILLARRGPRQGGGGNWRAAVALLTYMVFFAFAYRSLSAGTGALILFTAVQVTMFASALRQGEQFPLIAWGGFMLAIGGVVYLVLPGVTAPDPLGAAFMAIAGAAWGLYSLAGRGAANPLAATARNFLLAVPGVLVISLFMLDNIGVTSRGLAIAVASGAIASGGGYILWYAALPHLSGTRAATVQLSVPAIAAFGGAIFLAEPITPRLFVASAATLGGVAIVLRRRRARA